MAYNLGIDQQQAEAAAAPKSTNKEKYRIEWWQIGTNEKDIQMGEFHSANLKHFVKVFRSSGRYTLIYLERVRDGKVLFDRRSVR